MKFKVGTLTVEQRQEGGFFIVWQADPDSEVRANLASVRIEPLDALALLTFIKLQEAKLTDDAIGLAIKRQGLKWS